MAREAKVTSFSGLVVNNKRDLSKVRLIQLQEVLGKTTTKVEKGPVRVSKSLFENPKLGWLQA